MTDVAQLIAFCNRQTVKDCLATISKLNKTEQDALIRAFEYNPDSMFGDNLLVALNYLIK